MRKTRIAAATAAVVLAISSVALANGSADSASEPRTGVTTTSPTQNVATSSTSPSGPSTTTVTVASTSTPTSEGSTTTIDDRTPTTTRNTTSTTIDDRTSTTTGGTTSTTIDDADNRTDETRSVNSAELRTYTVGDAGTVTVQGMHLIAVDANPGWTVEIDEASDDRIKVEFERGEIDAEFELRSNGELRIRTHD